MPKPPWPSLFSSVNLLVAMNNVVMSNRGSSMSSTAVSPDWSRLLGIVGAFNRWSSWLLSLDPVFGKEKIGRIKFTYICNM